VNGDRFPVPRTTVLFGAVVGVLLFGALVVSVEALRHPLPERDGERPTLEETDSDPRAPIVCDQAPPREGQERESPTDDSDTAVTPGQNTGTQEGPRVPTGGLVSSNLLYDCPQSFDGRRVTYEGEVVGAVLERDGGAWVQLNDDVYAGIAGPLPAHRDYRGGNAGVGVFVPQEAVDDIAWVGGPDTLGDVLRVVGTFHRVDPVSADVAVIRAEAATVSETGGPFERVPLPDRRNVAIVVAVLALLVTAAERYAARNR
jgi:hypothetical protein